MNIPINPDAPVKCQGQIEVSSDLESVWGVLTDIRGWPSWQKAVTAVQVGPEIEEGTAFRWKAGGLSFRSMVHTAEPYKHFGWTGTTFGASAIHNWTFETSGGRTVVRVEESLNGILPTLFRSYFRKSLAAGIHINLEELRIAAERKDKGA